MSDMSVEYKIATKNDARAMALVMERANELRDGKPLSSEVSDAVLEDITERMSRHGVWVYVAVHQKNVVGLMLGYPYSQGEDMLIDPLRDYLSLLMVDPEYWGKGIASKLLDIAADNARKTGKQQLMLWTRKEDNDHARSVYEHKGYIATGRTRISKYRDELQVQYALDV